jgi:hypothetical protein
MPFQSAVNVNPGFGVPGDIRFDGPQRIESGTVYSAGLQPNIIGYGFTRDAVTGIYTVGGQIGTGEASVTGSIAAGTSPVAGVLTVTAVNSGVVTNGMVLSGTNVTAGTKVLRQLTGAAGGVGTYQLSVASTASSTTITGAGNAQVWGGILCNSKVYASYGTVSGGPLAPTLALPDYQEDAQFAQLGIVCVNTLTACVIQDQVQFRATDGAIATAAAGASATSGYTLIPGAFVFRYPTTAAGLILVKV